MANILVAAYVALNALLITIYGTQFAADGMMVLAAVLSLICKGRSSRPPKSDTVAGAWFSHEFGHYMATAPSKVTKRWLKEVPVPSD